MASITAWDPPRSFTVETPATGDGPGPVATEWTVEARGGGTCAVRVVHRCFADSDDRDGGFEGHAYGWATSFFRMRLPYLTHYPGQPCSAFQLAAISQAPARETWETIRRTIGIAPQGWFASTQGTPELSGIVERSEVTDPELLRIRRSSPQVSAAFEGLGGEEPERRLRLDRPAPGLADLHVVPLGDQTMVSIRFHLFGDAGAAVAGRTERAWRTWPAARFPDQAT